MPLDGLPVPLAAAIGGHPSVLERALRPETPVAVWRRPPRPALEPALDRLLAEKRRGPRLAEGAPEAAAAALGLPAEAALPLRADIALLASLYARLTGHVHLRLKLEVVDDDACRFWHVDRVGLRMLCTYRGPGTEWLLPGGATPAPGAAAENWRARRLAPFDVAAMKGSAHARGHAGVAHRSPPVSHLPPARRARVLLVVDAPACAC